jgi:hypothetical protein
MAEGGTAEPWPHRTPSSATILDMEASEKFTQAVPPNEAGNWLQLLPDAAAGMTATSSPYDVVLITPAPRGASLHAIHSTGSGYDGVGGVGMALLDQFRAPLDASAYIGIAFYARGSALTPGLTVQAGLNTVLPEMCMCDPGPPSRCNDQPTHDVVLTADWQRYTIIWADFKQDGYGNPVPTDPTRLTNFGFRANPAVDAGTRGAWDFWLDDVSFITTTTP